MAHTLQRIQSASPAAPIFRVARASARFGLHLLEMCAVMCIGVAVLDVPLLALAKAAGYSDPITDLPELVTVLVAFNMSAPMAIWMRVRHDDWRCIQEMSAAMFVEAFMLIAVAATGVLPRESLVAWQHSLMIPAMVVVMPRLDVYTGPMRHAAPT